MLKSTWEDVKREFTIGNSVTKLIIVNVTIFVLINLVKMFMGGNGEPFRALLYKFCISGVAFDNLKEPWRMFTSIFLHEDFGHILWNMLVFYWFGRIVGDLMGYRRILPGYLLGGLTGGLVFIISNSLGFMTGGYLLGASAGIMAILMVAGMKAPDYRLHLLFIGEVKLKYIALAVFFLDLVSISNYDNTGGHLAHIGGFMFGGLYVYLLNKGIDLGEPVHQVLDSLTTFFRGLFSGESRRKRPEKVFTNTAANKKKNTPPKPKEADIAHQEKLDTILDKIKQSGYNSLTQEEKEFLFKASNQ